MTINRFLKNDGCLERTLASGEVFSIRAEQVEIRCLKGIVWVTWPNGCDRIIRAGRQVRICARGKVCLTALGPSRFEARSYTGMGRFLALARQRLLPRAAAVRGAGQRV